MRMLHARFPCLLFVSLPDATSGVGSLEKESAALPCTVAQ